MFSVGQAILSHLSDVKGMSLWPDKFGPLGLCHEKTMEAINRAGSLLLKASELQQCVSLLSIMTSSAIEFLHYQHTCTRAHTHARTHAHKHVGTYKHTVHLDTWMSVVYELVVSVGLFVCVSGYTDIQCGFVEHKSRWETCLMIPSLNETAL